MAYVINEGSPQSATSRYQHFVDNCCKAFNLLRKKYSLLVNLMKMVREQLFQSSKNHRPLLSFIFYTKCYFLDLIPRLPLALSAVFYEEGSLKSFVIHLVCIIHFRT